MKKTHILALVCAFVSVLAASQTAVAGEHGIENRKRTAVLDITGSLPKAPAQWRTDQFLPTPSLDISGGHGTRGQKQTNGQVTIPPQWRADQFLPIPSLDISGGHGSRGQEQAGGQLMIPAQRRADRFLAMPSLDISGHHATQG